MAKMMTRKMLLVPDSYVRSKGTDEATVAKYAGVLADAKENGKRWPFPPLGGRPRAKKEGKVELFDGVNRLAAASMAKWDDEIPVDVRTDLEDDKLFMLAQVASNLKHGLVLSRDDRDRQIIALRDGENPVPLKTIAAALGVTDTWVSKIASGKGRKGDEEARRKGGKAKRGKKKGEPKMFTPADFYSSLVTMAAVLEANGPSIVEFRANVNPDDITKVYDLATKLVAMIEQ